jgi:hypothetical protein
MGGSSRNPTAAQVLWCPPNLETGSKWYQKRIDNVKKAAEKARSLIIQTEPLRRGVH